MVNRQKQHLPHLEVNHSRNPIESDCNPIDFQLKVSVKVPTQGGPQGDLWIEGGSLTKLSVSVQNKSGTLSLGMYIGCSELGVSRYLQLGLSVSRDKGKVPMSRYLHNIIEGLKVPKLPIKVPTHNSTHSRNPIENTLQGQGHMEQQEM